MTDIPRTWILSGRWWPRVLGPRLRLVERITVIEKAPVDAELKRMLDVIDQLIDNAGTDEDGDPWPWALDGIDLLREHGRLAYRTATQRPIHTTSRQNNMYKCALALEAVTSLDPGDSMNTVHLLTAVESLYTEVMEMRDDLRLARTQIAEEEGRHSL